MSSTLVHAIYPGEGYETIARYGNGWCSAPPLWSYIGKNYVKPDFSMSDISDMGKTFWALNRDERLPQCLRNVFCMTFDRAVIYKKNFMQAKQDLNDMPYRTGSFWMNLRDLIKPDWDYPAIGFTMTTVTETLFPPRGNKNDFDWSKLCNVYDYLGE